MIRSQLISKFNLLRASDLVLLNERCLQRSALCCAKPVKKRYRAPTEITDQQIEEAYYPRDDSLLDWNQTIGQTKRNTKNQNQSTKKQFKPFRMDLKKQSQDSTDPAIKKLFVEDSQKDQNYPNRLKLEGKFVIDDVISFGYPKLVRLYYSDDRWLNQINVDKVIESGVEPMKVDYGLIKRHSELVKPQGLVATVELQLDELFRINSERNRDQVPLIVVASNLTDPGPLIRTSLACGAIKLLSLKLSSRLLRSKIVRTSCGSIFRLPFVENLDWQDLEEHLPANATIYLSDSSVKDYSYLGDPEERSDDKPSENPADSTNSGAEAEMSEIQNDARSDQPAERVETVNYLDLNYFDESDRCVVLIVNGEKRISNELRHFIKSKNGKRLEIPLVNDVESLNSGIAASILISEIRRQYLNKVSGK